MKLKLNYFTKVVMRFMISKNNLKNFAKFKGQQMRWKSCFSKARFLVFVIFFETALYGTPVKGYFCLKYARKKQIRIIHFY